MTRIIVVHEYFGCETGCCGHVVRVADTQVGQFHFDHPYGEDVRAFVRDLVTREFGEAHVADIDWEHCVVLDD